MKAAVFVGLAFAVGILAENLSFKYVDSVEPPKPLPETINVLDLPSKGDTRVKTLIKNLSGKSPIIEPLATELASNGAFSLADPTDGIAVRNWICGRGQCSPTPDHACPSPTDNITKSILRVYYYAKNRTFENNNYYDEMKRIQTRVDFSRSIALIALIYCVLALLIVFIGIERAILRRIILRTLLGRICSPKKSDSNLNFIFQSMKANSTKLFITFILFIIYFAGMWSYQRESYEFNKRAFGYYVSMLIKENHNKSIGCEE